MKKRKRIAAALMCLALVSAVAVPAALAEKSGSDVNAKAEQRTEISAPTDETKGERAALHEGRGSRRAHHGGHEEAAEPENAIGKEAAKEAALNDAGLTSDQTEKLRARVSEREGVTVYKVSFRYEGQKYSYKIDPLTGEVLDKTVAEAEGEEAHGHGRHERREEAAEPENAIGREAAKEAALNEAGLTSDQTEKLRARVSEREGVTVYKVSFRYEGQKYSYKIDPLTGEVLDKTVAEAEGEEAHGHGRHERREEAAEPENAIGKEAAEEAALNEAGLTSDQTEKLRARVSEREGVTVYKVSFRYEGQKYSYKIDPLTGEVLDKTVSETNGIG